MTKPAARPRARVACVLLAAGGSRRLGRPKQLVRRGSKPLLVRALDAARGAPIADEDIVVVLGAHALRLRLLLRRHSPAVRIAANPRWMTGLASSLRAGLAAAPRDAAAALVLLVDQPDVDAESLRRLINAWWKRPGAPAAARYAERAGVPAVLPRRVWRTIRALDEDAGARAFLRNASELTLVDMPEAELDIDTVRDLARL
jgi:molybdenum cofactor cytidylyltransferase